MRKGKKRGLWLRRLVAQQGPEHFARSAAHNAEPRGEAGERNNEMPLEDCKQRAAFSVRSDGQRVRRAICALDQ